MYPGTYAQTDPDRPAVIVAETGQQMSYRQLDDDSAALARVLHDAGLRPASGLELAMPLGDVAMQVTTDVAVAYCSAGYGLHSYRLVPVERFMRDVSKDHPDLRGHQPGSADGLMARALLI